MEGGAVLLDIASIQRFVFSSNKLRDNMGASLLVESFYDRAVPEVCAGRDWQDGVDYRPGYVGGGNALYLFRDFENAQQFVEALSETALTAYPGLKLSAAIQPMPEEDLPWDGSDSWQGGVFRQIFQSLHIRLREQRSRSEPVIELPGQALTAFDPRNGKPAEARRQDPDTGRPLRLSSETRSKQQAAAGSETGARGVFHRLLSDVAPGERFPLSFEHLVGEDAEKSYMAVVHIDGNDMGRRFMGCEGLADLKKASAAVKAATIKAFQGLLRWLLRTDVRQAIENLDDRPLERVPMIPILMGGDDVTFVTDARLGLALAAVFMETFAEQPAPFADGSPLSACAGVAFVKLKYPFYRSVQLAEELTRSAKAAAVNAGQPQSCWIDFHISGGGMSGALEALRAAQFTTENGSLLNGPYRVGARAKAGESLEDSSRTLPGLLAGVRCFQQSGQWPRSKVQELRSVYYQGTSRQALYLKEMQYRGRCLPLSAPGEPVETLWRNQRTPWFDMVELIDFCPYAIYRLWNEEAT